MPTCIACGSPLSHIRLESPDHLILECPRCHLAKTEPDSYVSEASYDNAPGASAQFSAADPRMIRYAEDILTYLRPFARSGRMLDVGCSAGALVEAANRHGFSAEGIDLDSHAISAGQQRGLPVHCRSLQDWPGQAYDVITLKHVVEHLPDPVSFLRACAAKLRPGGILLIAVPGHTGLLPSLFPRWWYGWQPSQHHYHYSRKAMTRIAAQAGLAPLKVWHTPMDHWITFSAGWKTAVKSILTTTTARLGQSIGRGDQLVAVLQSAI
jgi:SAM-dependent methyltransferase